PLVAAAGAADPARADLPLLGDVAPELGDVLVVDLLDLALAEEARLAPAAGERGGALSAASVGLACGLCCHLRAPPSRLERDVVVGAAAEVRVGVGRGRAGRYELVVAAAAAAAHALVAAAEELHRVGDDLDRLTLGAVLRLPLAPLEAALHPDRP